MKIASLLFVLTTLAAQDPPAETPAAALKPFIDRHVLAGAVTLVATKDKVLSHEAVGFMDLRAQLPMRPDALFWIASQSKPITATANPPHRSKCLSACLLTLSRVARTFRPASSVRTAGIVP